MIGAITWNLITWYFTIPSSSSHALIGGLIGASLASVGSGAVSVHGIFQKVVAPGILAIFVCGIGAFLATTAKNAARKAIGPGTPSPRCPRTTSRRRSVPSSTILNRAASPIYRMNADEPG